MIHIKRRIAWLRTQESWQVVSQLGQCYNSDWVVQMTCQRGQHSAMTSERQDSCHAVCNYFTTREGQCTSAVGCSPLRGAPKGTVMNIVYQVHMCLLTTVPSQSMCACWLAALPPVISSLLATFTAFSCTNSSSFSADCLRSSAALKSFDIT